MYRALYRTRRPEIFSEILGQEHIVKILKHQIEDDSVSHAYLFNGTRGTGKTTTARILAKAVNCKGGGERPCGKCENCTAIAAGNFIDVIEIDAASNNGVDNIRELRESVKYPPQSGSKKVYIIDEVHMLSTGAFNALLKTLEEPPENVMFILCTTEPNKLPQTILSRCMRLDFKRIPQEEIARDMLEICEERGVNMSEGALRLISANADGSVRDGLSILDQVLASGSKEISREDVLEYLGTVGDEFFIELTETVSLRKTGEALVLLDRALAEGKDCKQLMKDWNAHYRNLLIAKFMKNPEDILNMSAENIERVKSQSNHISFEEIDTAIQRISKTINDARWSTQPRILMELDIVAISGAGSVLNERRRAAYAARPVSRDSADASMQPEGAKNPDRAGAPQANDMNFDFSAAFSKAAASGENGSKSIGEQLGEYRTSGKEKPDAAYRSLRQDSERHAAYDEQERGRLDLGTRNRERAGDNREQEAGSLEQLAEAESADSRETGESFLIENDEAEISSGSREWDREIDLEAFWGEVIDEGVELNGSFNLIRDWSKLESLDETVFRVSVEKEFAKKHLEEKSKDIEQIVSGILERPMKINIELVRPNENKNKNTDEEIARIAKEALGLDIIVEE